LPECRLLALMATAAHVLILGANYSNDRNGNMSALICVPPNGATRRARNTRDRLNPLHFRNALPLSTYLSATPSHCVRIS
jgi:hypothetical protein